MLLSQKRLFHPQLPWLWIKTFLWT
jgi:hypothetical protein